MSSPSPPWLGRGGLGCGRRGSGGSFGGGGFGRGFGFGFGLGFFFGEARVHFGGFGGMDLVVVLVRFGQLLASSSRPPKRSSVASSNCVSILMASNGQTSTQIWQLMQTEISMSKRVG